MAFRRALTSLFTFMVISMVVSPPFVQTSRTRFQGGTTVAEDRTIQELQTMPVNRFGKGTSGFALEDSERKVPTGPDPLHHNSNPSGP